MNACSSGRCAGWGGRATCCSASPRRAARANVVRALRAAREMGIVTVGPAGRDGRAGAGPVRPCVAGARHGDGAHPGVPHRAGPRGAGIAGGPSGGAADCVTILLTGAAGFIGYHVAEALLARGERVIGVDNLNAYYDVRLKQARLERLDGRPGFAFHQADVADREAMHGARPAEQRHRRRSFIWRRRPGCGIRWSIRMPMCSRT